MTEHTEPTPRSDNPTPPLDTDTVPSYLDGDATHRAKIEFIRSGQFLTEVNRWLDRTDGADTIWAELLAYSDIDKTPEDRTLAACINEFVYLATNYADNNYLSEATESHEPFYTRWVNVSHDGVTYQAVYMVGQGAQAWVKRLKDPLPEDAEVFELATILKGDQTERALRIDAKLAELATIATGLLAEDVPARALSTKLAGLSEEIAEQR